MNQAIECGSSMAPVLMGGLVAIVNVAAIVAVVWMNKKDRP